MPKEDYLQKYLEKLSRVIAAMLGFREKGFPEESLKLADEVFKELYKVDTEELAVMPLNEFRKIIVQANHTASYLEVIVQLTLETARNNELKQATENAKCLSVKALTLLELLSEKDKTFSFEREALMVELRLLVDKDH
jgi:hypothetical protein